jgi:hypothetical protein
MPQIKLCASEAVVITFAETDGEVTVAYMDPTIRSLTGCPYDRAKDTPPGISVHVDLADRIGREGIIYHEPFDAPLLDEDDNPVKPVQPVQPHDPFKFSVVKAQQLTQLIFDLFRLDQSPTPQLMSDCRDQLMAAAKLVDGLIKAIEDKEAPVTLPRLALEGVLQALHNGKL